MPSEEQSDRMKAGWTMTALGKLCQSGGGDIQTGPFGSQLHSADYVPDGIPCIMPTNIAVEGIQPDGIARIKQKDAERLERYRVKAGDIVYSRRGDVEKCALVTERENGWLCGTGCLRVRLGNATVTSSFLHAYLSSPAVRAWIVRHSIGATMPNLNTGILESLPVEIPPSAEMMIIGDIWVSLIRRSNDLAAMSHTLEAIARAIFTSWFVDFDPVRAKAEGREPDGMDNEVAALFPCEFQESERGLLPLGWSFKLLSEFVAVNPLRVLHKDVPAPYLEMANAPTTGPRPTQWVARVPLSGCRFRNGDTLLAKITPCLENGKTVFVDFLCGDQVGWGSTEFIVLMPQSPIPPLFVYLLARNAEFRAFAIQSMSGTSGRQRVQVDQLERFEFPIADEAIYRAFADIVEPIFRAISQNDNRAKTLADLRDTLLPRLISGKLRAPAAEKTVETLL